MLFGGSSRCSPISADSCPPDVSACAGMVGSHGLSPKLSPLFRSEDHAERALECQFSGLATKALFALSPAESAHPQNAPATPAESALPFLLDLNPTRINTYKKTPIRPGLASRLPAKVTNRMSFHRLIKSNLSEGSLRSFSVFVAPTCPDLSRVSREPREPSGAPLVFRVPHFLRFVQQVGLRSATQLRFYCAARSAE